MCVFFALTNNISAGRTYKCIHKFSSYLTNVYGVPRVPYSGLVRLELRFAQAKENSFKMDPTFSLFRLSA